MLPHLAERPLNLHRFPNGVGGPSFWQKDIPDTAPAWLRRWREQWDQGWHGDHPTGPDHRDANTHLVADEVATLCWLGNQASFEIHAWTSRLDAPMRPTYALIDIDPGDRHDLGGDRHPGSAVPDGARPPARDRLSQGHRQARHPDLDPDRAALLVRRDERMGPRRLAGRRRDGPGPRVVGVVGRPTGAVVRVSTTPRTRRSRLSLPRMPCGRWRARPVSAPIAWDELDDPDLRPDSWTIRSIIPRVAERGDLFAGALTEAQELPPLS